MRAEVFYGYMCAMPCNEFVADYDFKRIGSHGESH